MHIISRPVDVIHMAYCYKRLFIYGTVVAKQAVRHTEIEKNKIFIA